MRVPHVGSSNIRAALPFMFGGCVLPALCGTVCRLHLCLVVLPAACEEL